MDLGKKLHSTFGIKLDDARRHANFKEVLERYTTCVDILYLIKERVIFDEVSTSYTQVSFRPIVTCIVNEHRRNVLEIVLKLE